MEIVNDDRPISRSRAGLLQCIQMVIGAFRALNLPGSATGSRASTPHSSRTRRHGRVHSGFSQALDAVCPGVRDAIIEIRTNWFTGHSLGGALAVLAVGCVRRVLGR